MEILKHTYCHDTEDVFRGSEFLFHYARYFSKDNRILKTSTSNFKLFNSLPKTSFDILFINTYTYKVLAWIAFNYPIQSLLRIVYIIYI